jgi:hypothetical protein
MPLAYDTVSLEGFSAGILLLPAGSRTVVARTLTSTAVNIGDTVVSCTASVSTDLKAGTALSFFKAGELSRTYVLVSEDVTVATTATNIPIFSSKYAIATDSTARIVDDLLPMYGIQEFPLAAQTTTVDTTNTLSGTGTEKKAIRSDRTIQFSGVENRYAPTVGGDPALQLLKETQRIGGLFGRELYFYAVYPDGEVIEAAILVTDYNQPGSYNEVKKYSFTAHLQGSSFSWVSPYASVGY